MKILGYDEVDGQQVIKLNLIAFGWFLSPEQMEIIRRVDGRVPDYKALYAVEEDEVQSQVGVVTIDTLTTEGIEKIGFIWGVATRPSVGRKGYASQLMEEANRRLGEEGIRYSFLGTGKSWFAYDLYRNLGYSDLTMFKRGFIKCRKNAIDGVTIKMETDPDIIASLFYESSKKYLGFVKRPKNFLEVRKAWSWFSYDQVGIFYKDESPVGYFIASKEDRLLKLWEICCPKDDDIKRCISALESNLDVDYIMIDLVDRFAIEGHLRSAGFNLFDESWGILMVKDLNEKPSEEKIRNMYGFNENRFHMTVMDEY
jgi:ribosomal protein S18 acetylase RimI-like enzyme